MCVIDRERQAILGNDMIHCEEEQILSIENTKQKPLKNAKK
ncbi:hypothetical protein [Lederbergia sp. NSJ-179]|nr:hypothetical protein [Lederbergia sp. NSJ-179]